MKRALLLFLIISAAGSPGVPFTDGRDGQPYEAIAVSGKIWMSRNLNFSIDGSYCYGDDPGHCDKYGRLYTWEQAKKACPRGWHLASDDEWSALIESFGGERKAYKRLLEGGDSGFSAQLGGVRTAQGQYANAGRTGNYWTSTQTVEKTAWKREFFAESAEIARFDRELDRSFSCRCVRD